MIKFSPPLHKSIDMGLMSTVACVQQQAKVLSRLYFHSVSLTTQNLATFCTISKIYYTEQTNLIVLFKILQFNRKKLRICESSQTIKF
jgi:hypothetical protein